MGINTHRNQLCTCGSGKKFKHCHYLKIWQEKQDTLEKIKKMKDAEAKEYLKKKGIIV